MSFAWDTTWVLNQQSYNVVVVVPVAVDDPAQCGSFGVFIEPLCRFKFLYGFMCLTLRVIEINEESFFVVISISAILCSEESFLVLVFGTRCVDTVILIIIRIRLGISHILNVKHITSRRKYQLKTLFIRITLALSVLFVRAILRSIEPILGKSYCTKRPVR